MIDYLEKRGIGIETVQRYQIQEYQNGRTSLKYPTIGMNGGKTHRVKYTDGVKPKYAWLPHKPDDCLYYSAGHLKDAIQANGGKVYLLNGEPAIWAFHTYLVAGGWDKQLAAPAVAWFGEGSAPATLFDDLEKMGAKHIVMLPDRDEAGFMAALKVHDFHTKSLSSLPFEMRRLPFEFGCGQDFNDFWLHNGRDADKTRLGLIELETLSRDDLLVCIGKPEAPQQRTLDFKDMQHEWIESVIVALGAPAKREGRIDRWHCPIHKPDTHPSFRVETSKGDYPRPRCSCNIHDNPNAWDEIARTIGAASWEDFKKERIEQRRSVETQKVELAIQADDETRLKRVTHHLSDTDAQLGRILDGDLTGVGNPVIFPMRALHHLRGLCHHIPSGKIIGVIGGSGEGKTSLIETWVDFWNRMGLDVLLFSPEWTPLELLMRRIQRYSGRNPDRPQVTVEDMISHMLCQKETDIGIDASKREGTCLSIEQRIEADKVRNSLLSWPGETIAFFESDARQPTIYLEDLLTFVAATLEDGRKAGRRRDIVVYDYAQLLEVRDVKDGEREIEHVISAIKNHAAHCQYVAVVATQVTKASSKASKANGARLTSDDAQFVRSDKFNLMLSINRVYTDERDEQGNEQLIPTDYSTIYVDKNSLGMARGQVTLEIDFSHLLWKDTHS